MFDVAMLTTVSGLLTLAVLTMGMSLYELWRG